MPNAMSPRCAQLLNTRRSFPTNPSSFVRVCRASHNFVRLLKAGGCDCQYPITRGRQRCCVTLQLGQIHGFVKESGTANSDRWLRVNFHHGMSCQTRCYSCDSAVVQGTSKHTPANITLLIASVNPKDKQHNFQAQHPGVSYNTLW